MPYLVRVPKKELEVGVLQFCQEFPQCELAAIVQDCLCVNLIWGLADAGEKSDF